MLVSLPWASGLFRRDAHRPAAYLNILLTLLAFGHGSLILQQVFQSGPVDLAFPWLTVADQDRVVDALVRAVQQTSIPSAA